jgi:hypothetical protein
MIDPAPPDHRELPLDLLDQVDRIWTGSRRRGNRGLARDSRITLVTDRAFPADPFAHQAVSAWSLRQ